MIKLNDILERLIEALKDSELSQTELSSRIGVKQSQISCYLHGKKMPAIDTFANLCSILNLDANEILCLNDLKKD